MLRREVRPGDVCLTSDGAWIVIAVRHFGYDEVELTFLMPHAARRPKHGRIDGSTFRTSLSGHRELFDTYVLLDGTVVNPR